MLLCGRVPVLMINRLRPVHNPRSNDTSTGTTRKYTDLTPPAPTAPLTPTVRHLATSPPLPVRYGTDTGRYEPARDEQALGPVSGAVEGVCSTLTGMLRRWAGLSRPHMVLDIARNRTSRFAGRRENSDETATHERNIKLRCMPPERVMENRQPHCAAVNGSRTRRN